MDIRHENVEYSDLNIPIYCRTVASTDEDISANAHIHEEIEIVYVSQGSQIFSFIDESVLVHEGEIILINSMCPHCSGNGENTRIYILQFRPDLVMNNHSDYSYPYLAALTGNQSSSYRLFSINDNSNFRRIASMLIGITEELRERSTAYELNIMAYIYSILTTLFRFNAIDYDTMSPFNGKNQNLKKLEPVFGYVEKHYNEDISLDEVANIVNYSPQYFCRIFKDTTDKTFIDYLNCFRINVAKKMIINTNESIYNIYIKTGFSSFSYFNRIFKKYSKFSPTEYRQVFLDKQSAAD